MKVLQNGAKEICYTIPAETPAMKRTLDTTISRSKNEGSDKRHMPLFRVFPFKSLIVILERGL